MAILAHGLQIVAGFLAPLIIFFVKRDSKFVTFHALQALLLQAVNMAIALTLWMAWMLVIFTIILTGSPKPGPPPKMLFVLPVIMLGFVSEWLFVLFMAIVYGIKAGRGEWAGYPIIGDWARRILKV